MQAQNRQENVQTVSTMIAKAESDFTVDTRHELSPPQTLQTPIPRSSMLLRSPISPHEIPIPFFYAPKHEGLCKHAPVGCQPRLLQLFSHTPGPSYLNAFLMPPSQMPGPLRHRARPKRCSARWARWRVLCRLCFPRKHNAHCWLALFFFSDRACSSTKILFSPHSPILRPRDLVALCDVTPTKPQVCRPRFRSQLLEIHPHCSKRIHPDHPVKPMLSQAK